MDKHYGNYRAEVVDNLDELESGRVKVRVFDIHDELEEDQLPWAIYSDPFMGGAADSGGLFVPDIGNHIWVFFENGDVTQPVYFAGAPAKPHLPKEKSTGYPKTKVFKTQAGFVFEIDDSEGETRLRIKQPSGNELNCDHEGNVDDTIQGNLVINVESGHVIINSDDIRLGDESDLESAVLGEKLAEWSQQLTTWLNSHQHQGNLGSPTSNAITPFNIGDAASGAGNYSKKVKVQP